jgi:hypothetical protein
MHPASVGIKRFLKSHYNEILRFFIYDLVPKTQGLFKPSKTHRGSTQLFHDDVRCSGLANAQHLFKDTAMPFLTSMVICDMYVVQNRRSPHLTTKIQDRWVRISILYISIT